MTQPITFVRKLFLRTLNYQRLRSTISAVDQEGELVFFIFVDGLLHFLPFCLRNLSNKLTPIILLNGISSTDEKWVRETSPYTPVVRLQTSLRGNNKSILPHGEVLEILLGCTNRSFCIQDPDCFILDKSFCDDICINPEREFAAGPFTKQPTNHDHVLPDTFFLTINPTLYRSYRKQYGISADVSPTIPKNARKLLSKIHYNEHDYPELFKGYFDTLQLFWLAAIANGKLFRKLDGAGNKIIHIGGTSYLHNTEYSPEHWDYWPLSVQYINLLFLSLDLNHRFHSRFTTLLSRFPDTDSLLREYPDFRKSYRYNSMNQLWQQITASN
jgi:hypothetical protein